MRHLVFFISAFIVLSAVSGNLRAQTDDFDYDAVKPLVDITLHSSVKAVKPGQQFSLLIEQNIEEGWHTYWKNPGDSGEPTHVDWQLPQGFKASSIHWPAPQRLPFGPLMNFGYENTVYFPVTLIPPKDMDAENVTLKADVSWLVCKDICIPEYGSIELELPVSQSGDINDILNTDKAPLFEKAEKSLLDDAPFLTSYGENGDTLFLKIKDGGNVPGFLDPVINAYFFPEEWGLIGNSAPQTFKADKNGGYILTVARDSRPLNDVNRLDGVVKFVLENGDTVAYQISADKAAVSEADGGAAPASSGKISPTQSGPLGVLQTFLFAFLGGIILNLMPCVFPVLSMKALSLARMRGKERRKSLISGAAYTAGILVSFGAIAAVLIALQFGGEQIGWGFQFQSPGFVLVLAVLLFVVGLNLSGFFDIQNAGFMGIGGRITAGEGFMSSFMTGVLATTVATPCTAPFMATAIGVALVQPPVIAVLIFLSLGFGLAFPYLLISLVPAFQALMPRPGLWMDTFKQFLAYPMYASAIWLVWVLTQQIGPDAVILATGLMLCVTFIIWLIKKKPQSGRTAGAITVLAIFLSAGMVYAGYTGIAVSGGYSRTETQNGQADIQSTGIKWQEFSTSTLNSLLETTDDPVFVNMTAAWCITCKVNEKVALNTKKTEALFERENIQAVKGDWTNQDPEITNYLEAYGRSGVPVYVYYGRPDKNTAERPDPVILPQILTPGIVEKHILNGGRS